jgi:hypothetical protein
MRGFQSAYIGRHDFPRRLAEFSCGNGFRLMHGFGVIFANPSDRGIGLGRHCNWGSCA